MTDWSYRGGNIAVVTGGGGFTPGEVSGTAQGDMIVLSVGVRNGEVPSMGSDWTAIGSSPTASNATVGSSGSIGQVFTWICERGASAPSYAVTRGAGADVAMWTLVVLTPASGKRIVFDSYSSNTIAAGGGTTATTGALTTPQNDCLLYAVVVSGRSASATAFDATSPSTDSGSTSTGYTGTMTTEVWERRGNNNSTSGFDIGMAQAIAVKDTAGSTGTIQATLSATNRAGMLALVLKQVAASTGNALGSTVAAAATLSAGAATGPASAAGATLTAAASLPTVGSASGAVGAPGATLTAAATLPTAGGATGAASAGSVTLTAPGTLVAGTATGGLPKVATLRDDFTTLDVGNWTKTESTSGDVSASGGQLLIKAKTSYPKIESVLNYDLDESSVYVRLDDPGANTGVPGREVWFYVHDTADANGYGLFVTSDGSLVVHKKIANVNTYPASATYNATTMRYLRIREASSTVYFERSPDAATWTTIHSFASAAFISDIKVRLTAGNWAADESPIVVAAWDSVNASLGASNGATLTAAGTLAAGAATGAAEATGGTLAAAGTLVAGAASAGGDVSVAGVTVSAAASLPSTGAATGAASAGSQTLTAAGVLVAGSATGTLPKLATLTDSFDSLDLGKWEKHNEGTAGDIAVSGGTLNLKATGDYSVLRSVLSYDATDSSIIIQMAPGDVTAVAGREVGFEIFKSSTERYGVEFLSTGSLYIYRYEGGSQTFQFSATYDATSMNWLRIREAGGTVFWDRSPNGVTWTTMTTRSAAFSLANVKVDIYAGNYVGTESPARTATFDNVGFVPGIASGSTLTTAATLVAGGAVGSGSPAGQTLIAAATLISGAASAGLTPAAGYSYIVDSSAAYLIDASNSFLVEPIFDVEANGATLTAVSSLAAGNATSINDVYTYLVDSSAAYLIDTSGAGVTEPLFSIPGNASGVVLTATGTVAPGQAAEIGAYTYLVDSAGFYVIDAAGNLVIEPGPATAGGATVAATGSVVAGDPTAGASVGAAVLTAPASLVAGSGTTGTAATASGVTVTGIGAIIEGIATGATESNAQGTLLIADSGLIKGQPSGAAEVSGATVSASGSVVAGPASIGAAGSASGATLTSAGSIVSGASTGEAEVSGVVLPSGWSVIEGGLSVGANLQGVTLVAGTAIVGGRASGFRPQSNAAVLLTGI